MRNFVQENNLTFYSDYFIHFTFCLLLKLNTILNTLPIRQLFFFIVILRRLKKNWMLVLERGSDR